MSLRGLAVLPLARAGNPFDAARRRDRRPRRRPAAARRPGVQRRSRPHPRTAPPPKRGRARRCAARRSRRRPPHRRKSTSGTTPTPFRAASSRSISWLKLLLLWLLFLIWVKSADWVNRDSQIFDLGYGKWNPIIFFPFFAVLLLVRVSVRHRLAIFWSRPSCCRVVLPGDVHSVRRHAQQSGPAAREGVHARLVPLRIRHARSAKSA